MPFTKPKQVFFHKFLTKNHIWQQIHLPTGILFKSLTNAFKNICFCLFLHVTVQILYEISQNMVLRHLHCIFAFARALAPVTKDWKNMQGFRISCVSNYEFHDVISNDFQILLILEITLACSSLVERCCGFESPKLDSKYNYKISMSWFLSQFGVNGTVQKPWCG